MNSVEYVQMQARVDELERLACASVVGLNWRQMSYEQRQIVNFLYPRLKVVQETVVETKDDLTIKPNVEKPRLTLVKK